MSTSLDNRTEGAHKKRRLQNACDECRKKKVRCDSAEMPNGICSGCLNSKVKCTHVARRKKRGPKIGAPSHSAVKALVVAILSDAFAIPEDPEAIRSTLIDLANYARSLEKELMRARRREVLADVSTFPDGGTTPNSIEGSLDDDNSDYSETEALSEQFSNMVLSRGHNRHFGKSSLAMFFFTLFDIKEHMEIKKRPEFWSLFPWQLRPQSEYRSFLFDFPEEAHISKLIDVFFTQHNPFYPLLHRATFERSISEGLHLHDRSFGSLLLVVCAVASRICGDAASLPEEPCSNLGLGWRWFRQLTLVKTSFKDPVSLYELQTYCLAIVFLQTTCLSDSSWVLNGFAVRLAQERGIHRRKNPDLKPTLERELWKRAFWLLVVTDMFASCSFGRPRATTLDDFDIEPLIECDEEAWDDPDVDVSTLPTSKKSPAAFWNCFIRLVEITAFCQQALYPIKVSDSLDAKFGVSAADRHQKLVMELDSALNGWMDTIPSHLKWDPHCENETFFTQSVILYAVYYFTQVQVHRTFIPKFGENSGESGSGLRHSNIQNFPSMAICANAARSCLHVVDCHFRRLRGWTTSMLLAALFNSSIVLLFNVYRGRQLNINTDTQRSIADVRRCLDLFRAWEERHQLAGRLHDNFSFALNLRVPLTHQDVPAPSLKRQRGADAVSAIVPTSNPGVDQSNTHNRTTPVSDATPLDQDPYSSDLLAYHGQSSTVNTPDSLGYVGTQTYPFVLPVSSTELGSLPIFLPLDFDSTDLWSLHSNRASNQSTWSTWGYDPTTAGSQTAPAPSFDAMNPGGSFVGPSSTAPDIGTGDTASNPSHHDWDMFVADLDQFFQEGRFL